MDMFWFKNNGTGDSKPSRFRPFFALNRSINIC